MNFHAHAAAYTGRHLEGSGPILLAGVVCTGDEKNITQCLSSSGILHDLCVHHFDVDIYCSALTEPGMKVMQSLVV